MTAPPAPSSIVDGFVEAMDHAFPAMSPASFPQSEAKSKCYWIDNFPINLDERLADNPLPDEVDIVIIGSGITGAVAAYRLSQQQPDLRVALIEARGICSGATGRNGGHLGRPEVYDFRDLAKSFGPDDALRIRRLVLRNRDMMMDCVNELDAAAKVDLRLGGTIVVFATEEERQKFQGDLESARNQGYENECCILSPEEVLKKVAIPPESAQHGAAYLARCGTIYPRKLVNLLLETALERMPSLSMHPHTPVTEVSQISTDTSPLYRVSTSNRGAVKAKVVFHATNGYSSHLMSSLRGRNGVVGCQAHMLGVQPPKSQTAQLDLGFGYADFWHWVQQRPGRGPFLYGLGTAECVNEYNDLGTIPDDHPVKLEMLQFLRNTFRDWFPDDDMKKHVEYDWTGIQGFTADGSSIVGRPEKTSPGEFVSVGHNGEGMTRCFACSTVVTDMILDYLRGDTGLKAPDWFPRVFLRDAVSDSGSK